MLYIHVPFCRELCPFCSFHRIKYREDTAQSYFDMLGAELDRYAQSGFSFTTVYVGGGTPTVLPERLEEVLVTDLAESVRAPLYAPLFSAIRAISRKLIDC